MVQDTTRARLDLQRYHEGQALAESAIFGERLIAYLRLGLHVARGVIFPVGIALLGMADPAMPWPRVTALVLYTVFALGAPVVLNRVKPTAEQFRRAPYVTIAIDNAFALAMGLWPSHFDNVFQGEVTIAGLAVILGFSALRPYAGHVWWGTCWAMGVYAWVSLAGHFGRGLAWNPIVFAFVEASFFAMGWLLVRSSRQLREMFLTLRRRENLQRFLPRSVVDRVMSLDGGALLPVKREATVLFSDIRDFTSLSETMDPQALLGMLDEYFAHMSQVVQAHEGTVGKYIGDGMLAFWNVPQLDPAHPRNAVRAALDMRKVLAELNQVRANLGQSPLRIGIGIHTGTVAAGELGSGDGLHEYTVIGDAVNVASRVEGLTKLHQCDLLVSDATWSALGAAYAGRLCGEERVKGRDALVKVWAVLGPASGPPP